jgi:hypothetical protein
MSLIFATQLTAVATVVLAVGAIFTAFFAWGAFRKQSREVRAIEWQVADQRQVAERGQADKVALRMSYVPFPELLEEDVADFDVAPGDEVHMAVVSNESRRLVAQQPGAPGGRTNLVQPIPASHARVIGVGETYGFVFQISLHRVVIGIGGEARFTDDSGLDWQLDEDQHLKKLDDRDDW